ncbi:hypothetical protein TSACC_23024 [Terrimicrobium sacchariphilum]|uniref:Uncharacterized protein n=1 Tax=Terrimicrobium sacchariphilum TaxID=690879 RepID=A0A146GBJ8_TERSA|nr:hypothetical protein TSACC_23024 [Terrimicrobium sacchariphilum]
MQPSTLPIPEGLDIIQTPQSAIIRRPWFSHVV